MKIPVNRQPAIAQVFFIPSYVWNDLDRKQAMKYRRPHKVPGHF